MAKVTVEAGICNFVAVINALENEDGLVDVEFKTTCPNFKYLETDLTQVDPMECCFDKIGEGDLYDLVRVGCKHAACPIPTGIIKAVEVAANLALPKDVTMKIEK